MHFPSLTPLLAEAPVPASAPVELLARVARQLFIRPAELDLRSVILVALAGVVIQVLAYWIAAKVVVGNETGTLARAARLWLMSLLAGFGLAALLAIGFVAATASQRPVMLAVAACGWTLLAVLLALLLPAKVFETGLLRSFAILLLSGILVVAGQTALHRTLGGATLVRWPTVQGIITDAPEGRQRRLRHLLAGDPLGPIETELDRLSLAEERRKSFSERQEGLRAVFGSLEAQRQRLKPDEAGPATADYEAVRARYEELVKQMRADYAASLAPPAGAAP